MVAASPGEITALCAVAVSAVAIVILVTRGARAGAACAIGVTLTTLGALLIADRSPPRPPPPSTPGPGTEPGYVSSSACLACHPGEHASFGKTYHRTMTQAASPASVLAPLDGRALEEGGRTARLERRGDEIWATLPDPDAVIAGEPAADVTRRVVLTTGSHREQAYWVAGRRRGDLRLFPFVWFPKDEAFVPRREAFLHPPDAPMPPVRWAGGCISCHAVAGEPRHDLETDAFDTRAAELGVSCEACHGPGRAHVERHRDPVARYAQRASKEPDPTIVHPGKIAPERSAAVCGQCHAYAYPRDEDQWWTGGYSRAFRAGDALEPSRVLLTPPAPPVELEPVAADAADVIFWPDGEVRVGGREYNALLGSPCYERGEGDRKMTCLSCHAMHAGDPAGQIAPSRVGDRACTACHDEARDHSHHAAGSPGSACVSCHMPKTSFALLSAARSHRIDSPSAARSAAIGKPNACNLCHVDKTLAWTARWLTAWYGAPSASLPEERAPAAVREAIAGDAAVRALLADALGSSDALAAAGGGELQAQVLEVLRADPYPAVRFIAERSLRRISPPAPHPWPEGERRAAGLLPDGTLDPELVRALLAVRDTRAITIAE